MNKNTLDVIGSFVDQLFLVPGRVFAHFEAKREMDWDAHAREVSFYLEQGYVEKPLNFFTIPEKEPEFQIRKQTAYQEGFYQEISFESLYEPRNPFVRQRYLHYTENRTGYLIRWTHGDKPLKTVLCVHGFMMGSPREAERMFKVSKLFSMGLDVALCIHPFHWKRIAGPRSARHVYLTLGDTAFTNECVGQSVYDLHNVFLILKKLGPEDIGMIGASLGGYITGIYACLNAQLKFAAMMVPAFSLIRPITPDYFYSRSPFDLNWQANAKRAAEFHSALNLKPKLSPDDILVVASRGDQLCPFELVDELRKRWQLTRCHYRTGGHWLVFDKIRGRAWYSFLQEKKFIDVKKDSVKV